MAVIAYSPIARGGAQKDAVLRRIGEAHGKTGAQVSLRWLVQQGIAAIPRTGKTERLKENLAIFDFELSPAEMQEIERLARSDGRIVDYAYSGTPPMGLSAESALCAVFRRTRFHRLYRLGA